MIRLAAASALLAFATVIAVPAGASPTDDVRAAMIKLANAPSYELTFTSARGTGTIDFVKPGDIHMSGPGMEMIHVGSATYMKMGGPWKKLGGTSGSTFVVPSFNAREIAREADRVSATDLGMRTIDGETLHAYRVTGRDGRVNTIFVGGDGYPHRVETPRLHETLRIAKFGRIAPIRAPL